jgi:hypothetical protein
MPNWCDNNLRITHEDPAMITKLVDAWNADKFFGTIYPEPDYKTTPVPHTFPQIKAEYAKTEEEKALAIANEPTIREDSWWDWRVQNWGTKWEINTEDHEKPQVNSDGTSLFVYFNSAWSPPTGVYEKLIEQGYGVEAYYFEGGCAFCGMFTTDGGDECYSIDYPEDAKAVEMAEWFKDNIPARLLDEMDILSFYDCADWQLEEEEEA